MGADDYTRTYLQLWSWVGDTFTAATIRNYLQSGLGAQATRAAHAFSELEHGLQRLVGGQLRSVFEVQGDNYILTSLWRVYHGKGAPNEIQDALWLASLCGLVNGDSLQSYCDTNLGIDCGGFVANYWGMGQPTEANTNPPGATGYKPRTIWGLHPRLQRRQPSEIQVDDAAVFFKDVRLDDPNIAAHQLADHSYDTTSGSQAFHIGVVSSVAVLDESSVSLEISESSGAAAASGGNGVNVRRLGRVTATVAGGLVYCAERNNRIYFTGKAGADSPYQPYMYGS